MEMPTLISIQDNFLLLVVSFIVYYIPETFYYRAFPPARLANLNSVSCTYTVNITEAGF